MQCRSNGAVGTLRFWNIFCVILKWTMFYVHVQCSSLNVAIIEKSLWGSPQLKKLWSRMTVKIEMISVVSINSVTITWVQAVISFQSLSKSFPLVHKQYTNIIQSAIYIKVSRMFYKMQCRWPPLSGNRETFIFLTSNNGPKPAPPPPPPPEVICKHNAWKWKWPENVNCEMSATEKVE